MSLMTRSLRRFPVTVWQLPPVRRMILWLLCVCCVPATAFAQSEADVLKSRMRGVEFLKEKQQKDGHWDFKGHEVGITALCTVALIENGVPLVDPVVQKGYEYVKANYVNLKNTYDIALSAVLLSRVGDRRDRPKIKILAARLIAGQLESGGWTYTCPLADPDVISDRSKLPPLKPGFGDNSCTQFAVLGLWVASRTGIDIDETLVKVARRFTKTQLKDGGWHYNLPPDDEEEEGAKKDVPKAAGAEAKAAPKATSTQTMTGAGVFCLAVAQAAEIREFKKKQGKTDAAADAAGTAPTESLMSNPVFARAMTRVGQFAQGVGPGAGRYFLWSLERVGVLLGLTKIGDVDWFQRGADGLIKGQRDDGGWPSAWVDADEDGLSDTCFAILFLRKANLGSDISRLLEGEKEQKFQILGRAKEARFATLEEALAAAKAGETIRIDSEGPYKVGHLEISKDITLQSGFGYSTVFKFEVGKNRLGIKLKPETDVNARDMLTIKGAKVTLEGIKLQMDPPPSKQTIPWRAIAFQGGSLRLLNCTISESTKQGMAAVAMEAPGKVIIRNSLFAGGRAGVEITGDGKQEVLLDNSVIFSNAGIIVINDSKSKKPADASVQLVHSVIQAKEAFRCPRLVGKVAVNSELSVYQADAIGMSFLAIATSAKDRTWTGRWNIYDLKQWVGAETKANATVTDVKTWTAFWGGAEKGSSRRIAPFVGVRQVGNFSHETHAQDWTLELPGDAEIDLQKNLVGINSFMAGPGIAFDQYRETISYTAWLKGELGLDDASKSLASAGKE